MDYLLTNLKLRIHDEVLMLRNLEHLLESKQFVDYWETLNYHDQCILVDYVENRDMEYIKKLLKKYKWSTYESMSITKLRQLASLAGIDKYTKMSREELIRELW